MRVTQHRDDLIMQRDTVRAYTVLYEQWNYNASTLGGGDGSPRAAATPACATPGHAADAPAAHTPASASASGSAE